MPADKVQIKKKAKDVLEELESRGVLMCHDSELPSATAIIAGETIKGSWWPHPKGSLIFHALGEVLDSADLISPKLINGKVTLIHKDLFEDFFSIFLEESSWQLEGLKDDCLELYKNELSRGEIRSDHLEWTQKRKLGDVLRDLEKRLLIYCLEVHTETGAHAKEILKWNQFVDKNKLEFDQKDSEEAMFNLTVYANSLGESVRLPWE